MLEGELRRERLMRYLEGASGPMSGAELSKLLGVSRQVIVQDIALLRAVDKNILSTNKGYVLFRSQASSRFKRSFKVRHTQEQTKDELYCVIDAGGKILDVVVEHDVYGQITGDLMIYNRADADAFLQKMAESRSAALNALTGGVHFHTVEADSEEILDRVENLLRERRYLMEE